jgi:hypothetical protein
MKMSEWTVKLNANKYYEASGDGDCYSSESQSSSREKHNVKIGLWHNSSDRYEKQRS